MDNFYKKNKKYKKLAKKIDSIDTFLLISLIKVVGEAIRHGVKSLEKARSRI